MNRRDGHLLEKVSALLEKPAIENTWRATAAMVYRNWLEAICSCREEGQTDRVLIA